MDTLVSTKWLGKHLNDGDLVILDCSVRTEWDAEGIRNISGAADYAAGHIPGAGFADLTGALSNLDADIEFALPEPSDFCRALGALGVSDNSRVVLYDNSNSSWAARVWWMLRWVGFDCAAILDGGLRAWKADGHPLSTNLVERPRQLLTPFRRPDLVAGAAEVFAAIDNPSVKVIDTLPEEIYRGDTQVYLRPGHILTAVNLPATRFLGPDGRFLSRKEMDRAIPFGKEGRKITYCGGGILASLAAFVLTRLGHDDVSVYTASLQEWAADPQMPMRASETQ